jgi:hypothetical protein
LSNPVYNSGKKFSYKYNRKPSNSTNRNPGKVLFGNFCHIHMLQFVCFVSVEKRKVKSLVVVESEYVCVFVFLRLSF